MNAPVVVQREKEDELKRVRRVVAVGVSSALMLSVAAFPALAIGDAKVPAEECSGNINVVGTPQGKANPGITQAEPVVGPNEGGGPVSANNPGESTGAKGDERSGINSTNCQSAA